MAVTGWDWLDPVVALVVAAVVAVAGVRILTRSSRVLVDETLPDPELEAIRDGGHRVRRRGIVGFHELRGRQAGARRHVDLHVQFRAGTTLEEAHGTAHRLQDAIRERLGRGRRAHPPRARGPRAPRPGGHHGRAALTPRYSRLIAADAPTTRKTAA